MYSIALLAEGVFLHKSKQQLNIMRFTKISPLARKTVGPNFQKGEAWTKEESIITWWVPKLFFTFVNIGRKSILALVK